MSEREFVLDNLEVKQVHNFTYGDYLACYGPKDGVKFSDVINNKNESGEINDENESNESNDIKFNIENFSGVYKDACVEYLSTNEETNNLQIKENNEDDNVYEEELKFTTITCPVYDDNNRMSLSWSGVEHEIILLKDELKCQKENHTYELNLLKNELKCQEENHDNGPNLLKDEIEHEHQQYVYR